jgi:hypothetical protein
MFVCKDYETAFLKKVHHCVQLFIWYLIQFCQQQNLFVANEMKIYIYYRKLTATQ